MKQREYLLTIRIPIKGMDDVDARQQVKAIQKYFDYRLYADSSEGRDKCVRNPEDREKYPKLASKNPKWVGYPVEPEYRLQRVYKNKPPERVPGEL